tara:strand:- start:3868 stop:5409 length:1542 start_codon:yes stop_codon:yes gene_type:complete
MDNLEFLLSRSLDAVIGMDTSGRVTAWNAAAETIFGWSTQEAVGASLGELIVPVQHRKSHADGLEHFKRTGEGPVLEQRIQIAAIRKDGNEFPVELSIFATGASDDQRMFYAFVRDRSEEDAFQSEQEMRVREASAIMRVGQKLIEDISLDEFTQFCLKEVCDIANLDAGHLYEVRGEGNAATLQPSKIWHLQDNRLSPIIDATSRLEFRRGQGLPGRAWDSADIEAIGDLSSDNNFIRRQAFTEVGLTKGVALPVGHGGKIHAVLEFYGTNNSRLDPAILRLLTTMGSQVGAAIRRKQGAESREILRNEMLHRVSNSLTVLASIYRNCSRRASSIEELDEMFLGRIMAMGRANKTSIMESDRGIPIINLIHDAIAILPDDSNVTVEAASIVISGQAVMPISLILHELGTNALKYGDLSQGGQLQIQFLNDKESDDLHLFWREQHLERTNYQTLHPERQGFGTRLIQTMIEGRLGGSFERLLGESDFYLRASFPRNRLEATDVENGIGALPLS